MKTATIRPTDEDRTLHSEVQGRTISDDTRQANTITIANKGGVKKKGVHSSGVYCNAYRTAVSRDLISGKL